MFGNMDVKTDPIRSSCSACFESFIRERKAGMEAERRPHPTTGQTAVLTALEEALIFGENLGRIYGLSG